MRLSFFMAIVPLHSPVACTFPVGGHHRTMPDGSGSAQRYHNPDLAASDFSPASFLTAVTTVARPRLTALVQGGQAEIDHLQLLWEAVQAIHRLEKGTGAVNGTEPAFVDRIDLPGPIQL